MFASWHAYLDFSSGAALAMRDLFEDLTAHGWPCRVVCGPRLDYGDGREPTSVLRDCRIGYHREQCAPARGAEYELYHFTVGGVPISQYRPASPRTPVAHAPGSPAAPTQEEGVPFLDVVERACIRFRPDVVLTYGGPPIGPHLIKRVRRHGAKVVFAVHNLSYRDRELLGQADVVQVPSEFARRAYRERVGIEAEVVEYPRSLRDVIAERNDRQFVTFVNPVPQKGVAWFARIALEMSRRRPEIPSLVVEGRGGAEWLQRMPLDLSGLRNLHLMRSTPRPKEFYARSRMLLMPSLAEETFGRVAAEAMANGIPVLASNRGALPETLGDAGFVFDIPERYTAASVVVPAAEEVGEWVATIERLWDDSAFYEEQRQKALARAQVWEPDRLRPKVEDFFQRVAIA
jgi:glycosyltransferase involved in cell wall biosynthesis